MADLIAEIGDGPRDPILYFLQSSGSQSLVPGPAITTSLRILLEMLILCPHQDQWHQKPWGWGSAFQMNQMPTSLGLVKAQLYSCLPQPP